MNNTDEYVKPNQPIGGTEILANRLNELLDMSSINLIISVCDPALLSNTKPNVLWQHLSYDQDNVKNLQDPNYVRHLDAIVFVSHWQHEQFRKRFPLDDVRCYVIQNAVDGIAWRNRPDKLKLVYTSTPWRGLYVLAESLKQLDRDVDVEIYSGTSIYGPSFAESTKGQFDALYDDLKRLGAHHIEYAPNSTVRSAVQSAHILAYPSVFEETSCLAAVESLMAGCKVVTTNFGALYETCSVWADYVPLSNDLVNQYTEALRNNIDNYWSNLDERRLQHKHYNKFWTWDRRIGDWESLLNDMRKMYG